MSTSLLYHGFGIQGYHYVRTTCNDGQVIFSIKPAPFSLCCPICGSKDLKHRGTITRMFKTVPIGAKAVFIQLPVQRVQCLCCNAIRQLKKFANTLASYSFGILNHYDYPISTGPLEVTNNKIKTLQRQAYGF